VAIDMQELAYQDLFNRIFKYIRLSGASSNRNSVLTAVKLIEEQLAGEPTGAIDLIMSAMQSRLNVTEVNLPLLSPKVNRSSIGYRDE
jgi:hypothetical protein